MKKTFKKLSAILLIAILCFGFSVPVTALEASEYSLEAIHVLETYYYEYVPMNSVNPIIVSSAGHLYNDMTHQFISSNHAEHHETCEEDLSFDLLCNNYVFAGNTQEAHEYEEDEADVLGEVAEVVIYIDITEESTRVVADHCVRYNGNTVIGDYAEYSVGDIAYW